MKPITSPVTNLPMLLLCWLYWLAPSCIGQEAQRADPAKAVATVNGQPIFEQDLLPLVQVDLHKLATEEFEIKTGALQTLVGQRLLEAEAQKRGVPVAKLVEQQSGSSAAEPSQKEIEAYYLGQATRSDAPFAEVKAQIRQALIRAKRERAREEFIQRLRQKAQVAILLRPPKFEVGYDAGRIRGAGNADVVIVEFSDFQCPFCRGVEPTLKALLAKYEGRVSLAYRDFPLSEIHPKAQKAAEAARCAGAQGKFWEYHDLLFANQSKLDEQSLREHARGLGLDTKEFESCLTSGKYQGKVNDDLQDGLKYGISATPSFFINGVSLDGAQPAKVFESAIEQELSDSRRLGEIARKR